MTVNASNLGAVVVALTAQGDTQIIGEMVSYCDTPTVGLCGPTNSWIVDWRADMCRPASPQEEIEYWKQRALRHEHPTEIDLLLAPPPYSIAEQCAQLVEASDLYYGTATDDACSRALRHAAAAIRTRFKP